MSDCKSQTGPARFWRYVVAAVDKVHRGIGEQALSLLNAPGQPTPQAVVTALVNQLVAYPDEFVLILDDYHLIESQPVHDIMPNREIVALHNPVPAERARLLLAQGELKEAARWVAERGLEEADEPGLPASVSTWCWPEPCSPITCP